MKTTTTTEVKVSYTCEVCGRTSRYRDEIEQCEARGRPTRAPQFGIGDKVVSSESYIVPEEGNIACRVTLYEVTGLGTTTHWHVYRVRGIPWPDDIAREPDTQYLTVSGEGGKLIDPKPAEPWLKRGA